MTDPPGPRLPSWEWVLLGVLFLGAAAMRLQLVDADYFSDEPMSYSLSRHGLTPPANVHEVDGSPTWHYPRSWYWERPAFYLGMAPAAMISFTAYRVEYILIASLLAPLAAQLLRFLYVRPAFAYPVGAIVALHPQFFVWGAITHMDTPMTVALAGGFLAGQYGRHRLAAVLFVLAVWSKETAMPFLIFVFFAQLVADAWRTRRVPWPLQLDGHRSALLAGILFGFLPFIIAQEMFFGLPGESATGRAEEILDGVFFWIGLAPLILLGLRWDRTREVSIWALAFPAFYLALHVLFDWNVREWYLVGSAFFALVASAVVLDEAWTRASVERRATRAVPAALGVALLLVAGVMLVVPDSDGKRAVVNPLARGFAFSLEETIAREEVRDLNGRAFLAAVRAQDIGNVLVVDVHYAFVQHPIPDFVDDVRQLDSNELHARVDLTRAFVESAENYADLVVMGKRETPANQAIRDVYADCAVHDASTFVFIDASQCLGRFERLHRQLSLPPESE